MGQSFSHMLLLLLQSSWEFFIVSIFSDEEMEVQRS